jgi:hypothetical protein
MLKLKVTMFIYSSHHFFISCCAHFETPKTSAWDVYFSGKWQNIRSVFILYYSKIIKLSIWYLFIASNDHTVQIQWPAVHIVNLECFSLFHIMIITINHKSRSQSGNLYQDCNLLKAEDCWFIKQVVSNSWR